MSNLEKLVKEINKQTGKETAYVGTNYRMNTPIIASTGSFALDVALACGGLPEGRILEYYGEPSGGKTTLALISAIEVQKKGKNIGIVDLEGTFTRDWFENLGGDSEKLLYTKPDSGKEAFETIERMVKSEIISLIVVDSVSAMTTATEMNAEYGDAKMTQLARLMSDSLKVLNVYVKNSKCSVVFINQTRDKVGVVYGNPTTTTGGHALKFYSSIRLEVKRGEAIGEKEDPAGFLTKIKVIKNKCGRPFRKVATNLYIGKDNKYGIDKNEEIIDVAFSIDVIKRFSKDKETGNLIDDKEGSWYKFNDIEVFGKPKFLSQIIENPIIFEEVKKKTIDAFEQREFPEPEEGSFNDEVNKELAQQEVEQPKRRARKVKDE